MRHSSPKYCWDNVNLGNQYLLFTIYRTGMMDWTSRRTHANTHIHTYTHTHADMHTSRNTYKALCVYQPAKKASGINMMIIVLLCTRVHFRLARNIQMQINKPIAQKAAIISMTRPLKIQSENRTIIGRL